MRSRRLLLPLLLALAAPVPARAACDDCAARYVELAQVRGIQAEIDYLLPSDPLELDRRKREPEKERGGVEFAPGRIGWLLISGAILAALLFLAYRFGAGGLVSLRQSPEDGPRRGAQAGSEATPEDEADGLPDSEAAFLAQIEGMADRRKALHLLSRRLLSRASEQAGIRPGRGWTAREALRALPRSWATLADLRHLNRHAELAWFGGRAVDDGVFADCIETARAVLRGGAAR